MLHRFLIDRDRLMNANKAEVARDTVTIFDRIQHLPKQNQVLATAAAFLLLCTASGIEAQDAFTAVKNLMHDPLTSTRLGLQFQAMAFHLKSEVLA